MKTIETNTARLAVNKPKSTTIWRILFGLAVTVMLSSPAAAASVVFNSTTAMLNPSTNSGFGMAGWPSSLAFQLDDAENNFAFWMTVVGTICWAICFWWMRRFTPPKTSDRLSGAGLNGSARVMRLRRTLWLVLAATAFNSSGADIRTN